MVALTVMKEAVVACAEEMRMQVARKAEEMAQRAEELSRRIEKLEGKLLSGEGRRPTGSPVPERPTDVEVAEDNVTHSTPKPWCLLPLLTPLCPSCLCLLAPLVTSKAVFVRLFRKSVSCTSLKLPQMTVHVSGCCPAPAPVMVPVSVTCLTKKP